MKVENRIKIYVGFENGEYISGEPELIVTNTILINRVKLRFGNISIEVSADDLQKAIRNATNI